MSRARWAAFIREITGRIAQSVQGLKGRQPKDEQFWLYKPFTRVVRGWKKAFRIVCDYVELNILEAENMINRTQARELVRYRALWAQF